MIRFDQVHSSGWQPMSTAPRNASWIRLRNSAGEHIAHFAHGGGDEQPPFGPGWFYAVRDSNGKVLFYAEIVGDEPDCWKPLTDEEMAEISRLRGY